MLEWIAATEVRAIATGTRRFVNPLARDGVVPFPGYVEEPVGSTIEAPAIPGRTDVPHDPLAALVGRPTASDVVPEFAVVDGRSLVAVRAAGATDRYGLGEVCGRLRHMNRRVIGATRDAFGYNDTHHDLYQAHPWVLCVRADGTAFGVIVETTYRFTAHIVRNVLFEVEGPPPTVTVIEGDDPAAVLGRLADLTGHMPLPPRWALGFQQSKWSYTPADEVLRTAAEFRKRQLPADVIWVDIDYMDAFKVFTFDPDAFADPAQLVDDLHDLGWRSAWMIDPGIKVEPGYAVYDSAIAEGHLLTGADGAAFEGVVWPGPSVFPDFTRHDTRAWWARLYEDFLATGLDAVWNDMNEPANLDDLPNAGFPRDVAYRADAELGGPSDHARYQNIYGMQMTRASHEGMLAARPDRRPFLLTRSTFLGGHRYAATWTGDNTSNWDHLAWSIPMALNLGLSGQPFVGPDIGGFDGACDGALLARWMGIGCLLPFARNHNMKAMPDQEPWAFGTSVEETCRRALERRYRLLPYLYTLAHEAATTGVPIVRPAFFADLTDRSLRGIDTAFLLGRDVYVRCDVTRDGVGPVAPVPTGWRRIEVLDPTGAVPLAAVDHDLPELYLRPGAVLPLGPVMQWSDELPLDEVTLLTHLDDSGVARGVLYEDDGDGYAHLDGAFRLVEFVVTADGDVTSSVIAGDWPSASERFEPLLIDAS